MVHQRTLARVQPDEVRARVHLAALGCPLLGDRTYGRPPREADVRAIADALGRQALHERTLAFVHPATGPRCQS